MIKSRTLGIMLLIIIVVLAEYGVGRFSTPAEQVTKTTSTSTTTIVSTTTQTKTVTMTENASGGQSISGFFPDKGFIGIETAGNFQYVKFNMNGTDKPVEPVITLRNVTFTYLDKGIIIGPICSYFNVTFPDGSSEELSGCSMPTNFESSITFTKHDNPKAGMILLRLGSAIYLLVSM